jgi:cytoskeletal protein RodZ
MLKLGELFKSERAKRGLELSQVSESTKIPQRLLKALEEGDYERFSSEVYLQGFLKNYAKFLEIDINKTLAIYRRERKSYKEGSLNNSQKPIEDPKPIVTPGRLVFLITIIIVLTVVTFIAIQVNKIIQPPTLELSKPAIGIAPAELYSEVDSDTITISGKVEVGSKLLINGSEVTTNNLQEFRVDNYKLNPGSNEIFIVAESYYFSKTSQIKLTVTSNVEIEDETTEESTAESEQEGDDLQTDESKIEKMEVTIEVGPEDAWVIAKIDGETRLADTIEAGESFTFEATQEFTIYSPRPQMVKLTINEEEYSFSAQTEAIFKLVNGEIVQE